MPSWGWALVILGALIGGVIGGLAMAYWIGHKMFRNL